MTKPRAHMIQNQLRPCGIADPAILAAFAAVPREDFLPQDLHARAYTDATLIWPDVPPSTKGGFMLDPLTYARLLALAAPQPTDVALLLAADGGYAAAVLAPLVREVHTELPPRSHVNLIILCGAVAVLPTSLMNSLAPAKGRLVAVLRPEGAAIGQGVLVRVNQDILRAFESSCPYL